MCGDCKVRRAGRHGEVVWPDLGRLAGPVPWSSYFIANGGKIKSFTRIVSSLTMSTGHGDGNCDANDDGDGMRFVAWA